MSNILLNFSDPIKVQSNANKYFGKHIKIFESNRKDKKYMVLNPKTNKFVHFGAMGYEDFTKHKIKLLKGNT